MDTKQIEQTLGRIFHDEEARIVFWNDPGEESENAPLFPARVPHREIVSETTAGVAAGDYTAF